MQNAHLRISTEDILSGPLKDVMLNLFTFFPLSVDPKIIIDRKIVCLEK